MEKANELIKKYKGPILVVIGVLAIYLISVFPPSGDDFNRLQEANGGASFSLERVARLYKTLNGRVLGNEISYVFIGRAARTIFKSVSLVIYFYLMMRLINIKKVYQLLIIIGSVILMPLPIFRQVLVWSAGFYNYFPPILLILLLANFFVYHRRFFTWSEYVGVFIVSLAACLFMENLALYMLVFPFLMALCFWRRENKLAYGVSFLGALAGNIIMFMSPVYRKVSSGDDGYREVATNIVDFVLDNWSIFAKYLLVFNIFVMAIFAFTLIRGTRKAHEKKERSLQVPALINLILLVPFSLVDLGRLGMGISLILHISFYLLILLVGLREMDKGVFDQRLLVFACLSMAVAMGPLILVSPVSARNFFTPIVFNILILVSLIRHNGMEENHHRAINKYLPLVMLVVFLAYVFMYTMNWRTFKERDRILRQAVEDGLDEVQVPAYPFKDLNGGYGTDSMGNFYYKEKKRDMKIKIEK